MIYYYKLGDIMKKVYSKAALLTLILIVFSLAVNTGCVSDVKGTSSENEETTIPAYTNYIDSSSDIDNLVTDDYKLVINYYDAYIWVVFFNQENTVDSMLYAYDFNTCEEAADMVETRRRELQKNKTMTITSAYSVDNYVVMELLDSSFDGLSRDILENNFNGLIVR